MSQDTVPLNDFEAVILKVNELHNVGLINRKWNNY